jgi:hypothetical protein
LRLDELDLVAVEIEHVQRRAASVPKDVVGLAAVARDLYAELPHLTAHVFDVGHDERPAPILRRLVRGPVALPQAQLRSSVRGGDHHETGTDSAPGWAGPKSEDPPIELDRFAKVANGHGEPPAGAARRGGAVHVGPADDCVDEDHGWFHFDGSQLTIPIGFAALSMTDLTSVVDRLPPPTDTECHDWEMYDYDRYPQPRATTSR